jgi:hypothetical protein
MTEGESVVISLRNVRDVLKKLRPLPLTIRNKVLGGGGLVVFKGSERTGRLHATRLRRVVTRSPRPSRALSDGAGGTLRGPPAYM